MAGSRFTGLERFRAAAKLIIGADDMDNRLKYIEDALRARNAIELPVPGTFGSAKVVIGESLATGVYRLAIASPAAGDGVGSARHLSYDIADSPIGRITVLPYVRGAGIPYYLGFRHNERPVSAVASSGHIRFKYWEQCTGESGVPNLVDISVPGQITFRVDTLVGGVWPNHATVYRKVHVWLNTPVVSGAQAFYVGEAKSNGTHVTVTVPHTFGQTTASDVEADYTVLIEGLTISTTDISAETDADGNPEYWFLGTVTDGVFDTSGQVLIPAPGANSLDLLQLVKDCFDAGYSLDQDGLADLPAPLQELIRMLRYDLSRSMDTGQAGPAVYIGDIAATKTWVENYVITAPGGGIQRFTWATNLPAGGYALAADADGRMRSLDELVARQVDFAEASPAGDYVIYIEATEVDTGVGTEEVQGTLGICTAIEWLGRAGCPYLLAFHWDGAVVSAETPSDLIRAWRPWPDGSADRVLKNAAGRIITMSCEDRGVRPVLRMRGYLAADAVAATLAKVLLKIVDYSATERLVEIPGPKGEDDNAGSGDLGVGEAVYLRVGGLNNWEIMFQTALMVWRNRNSTTIKAYLDWTGGHQDTNDGDGQKPRLVAGDFQLLNSKTVEVVLPLKQADDIGGVWAYIGGSGTARWSSAGTDALWFEAPHRVGQRLKGFRVRAWFSGAALANMGAEIYKADADAAGTMTSQALLGGEDHDWGHADNTPTSKTITLNASAAGSTIERYLLALTISSNDGTAYVNHVTAIYQVSEI